MRFAGYAAIFDRIDRGGDIVRKGAFARAVKEGPGRLPLLWQHDPGKPIGRIICRPRGWRTARCASAGRDEAGRDGHGSTAGMRRSARKPNATG